MAAAPTFKPLSIDQHLTEYAVLLYRGEEQWDISQLITQLSWTESFTAPSVEMNISLAAPKIRSTILASDVATATGETSPFQTQARRGPSIDLNNLVKLGMGIRVFAARPQPSGTFVPLQRLSTGSYALAGEIFRGYIFTKSRAGASTADAMEITVFDQMIYLAKNDYDTIFKNRTATEIIRSLCGRSGLKMAKVGKDFSNTQANIKRLVSYGNNLYDCCYLAIQKNKHITGKNYRLRSEAGTVVLRPRTTPTEVWYLTDTTNVIESQYSETIEELVTGVQPKTQGPTGRSSYHKQRINANLEKLYGRMRKVQDLSNLKASEVSSAVKNYMAENSKPKVEMSVTIPCINTIRAGDLIKVRESDTGVIGLWYVSQVAHTVSSSTATSALQLVKTAKEADVQKVEEDDPATGKSSNRHVTYDKIKGHDGKYIRYSVTAGVYVPKGKFGGDVLQGDEDLVKLGKGLAANLGQSGSHVQLQFGRLSRRCIVQVRGDYKPYDLMVSQAAADHLGITNGNHIWIFPLRKHVSGGSGGSGPGTSRFDSLILDAGSKWGVRPALIKAIIKQESSFNPNIVNRSSGATGLMQLMPGTAKGLGLGSRSLTTPSVNIDLGTHYIRDQLHTFHDYKKALAAYNAGPGAVKKYGGVPPFTETQNYVRIVMANYNEYWQAGFGR